MIDYTADIGPGLYIGHFGQIIVHPKVSIGKNCSLSQGVTIGLSNRGENVGAATIGDEVFIGPGAKVIGKVNIGNRAAIGANAVVLKDVPDQAVAVGVPAKIISYKGSEGYVNNIVYDL
jgi:serine O-acetyltransferase